MTSKVIPILTFVSIICLSESIDWCSLIKTNNTYKGLGIYHQFDSNGNGKYVMYNRYGKQWLFDIIGSEGLDLEKMRIRLNDGDSPNDRPGHKYRYGLYFIEENDPKNIQYADDCYVTYVEQLEYKNQLYCQRTKDGKPYDIMRYINYPQFRELMIMKESPFEKWNKRGSTMVVFNRLNKKDSEIYNHLNQKNSKCSGDCVPFVGDMNQSLFEKIEGVVDYVFGMEREKSGWLLLFNIDGRPKYCFTKEGQLLSDMCKSTEKMPTLFDECFVANISIPTQRTTTTQSEIDSYIFLIVGLTLGAVIFLIIVVITGLFCFNKCRKKRPIPMRTSTSQTNRVNTPITSVKTETSSTHKTSTKPSNSPKK